MAEDYNFWNKTRAKALKAQQRATRVRAKPQGSVYGHKVKNNIPVHTGTAGASIYARRSGALNWATRPINAWGKRVNRFMGSPATGTAGKAIGFRGALKGSIKMLGSPLGLALGPGLGFAMGYQEGGAWGGVKGIALQTATDTAIGFAANSFGLTGLGIRGVLALGGIGIAAAGIGYATYAALDYGNRYMRQRNKMELSSPNVDIFGTAATMRQRSLSAMHESHTNMRSALGNEAMFLHR